MESPTVSVGERALTMLGDICALRIGAKEESKRLSGLLSEHQKDLAVAKKQQKGYERNFDLPQDERKARLADADKMIADTKTAMKFISDPIKPSINAARKAVNYALDVKAPELIAESKGVAACDIKGTLVVPSVFVKPAKPKK